MCLKRQASAALVIIARVNSRFIQTTDLPVKSKAVVLYTTAFK
jgi:hypothetical protein